MNKIIEKIETQLKEGIYRLRFSIKENKTVIILVILGIIARLIGILISMLVIKYIFKLLKIEYKRKK